MSDDNDNSDDLNLENGHYSENSDRYDTRGDSDTEYDEDEQASGGSVFDKTLPTSHKYLGQLDHISSYTLYDDGQMLTSMIGIHTNTLVFPGFTLPMILEEARYLFENIGKGYMFVLMCNDKKSGLPFDYGVIMEIYETSRKRDTINLKAKGRQRCQIMRQSLMRPHGTYRIVSVSVKALGEPKITTPIIDTELVALKQKRCIRVDDYDVMQKYRKHRKYHLVQYPFPSWIYDYNEICFYVKHVTDILSRYYERSTIPKDPVLLSYWFVQNFQLSHEERLDILKCNNVWERLRMELKFLKLERLICCMCCKIDIAMQKDVFAMSKEGVQNNYCNPVGQVYETVTVLNAKNYQLVGESSRKFSWFPGYKWTIMQCQRCRTHLGWQFTSEHLQPLKFYGLANSGIDIKINDNTTLID